MNKISFYQIFKYSFIAIPIAFAGIPLYILAPDFYATNFEISMATIGFMLLALRIFDAIFDPVIGFFCDKLQKYRWQIMLIFSVILVLSFYGLFVANFFDVKIRFFIGVFLSTFAYSVLTINLNSLGGLWGKEKNSKTKITTIRESLTLIGILLAVIIPGVCSSYFSPQNTFLILTIVLSILLLISLYYFKRWFLDFGIKLQILTSLQLSFLKNIPNVFRQDKKFFVIYFLSMFASSMPAVLVLFFIRDLLNAENLTGLFLLLYFLSGALTMPFWHLLSKKTSKKFSWKCAMYMAVIVFVGAFLLGSGDIWQYSIICLLSGMAFGADLAMPPAIIADIIQKNKNEAIASLHFGILAFIAKFALAVGSVVTFSFLEYSGFKPAQINGESQLLALSIVYALFPCLIKFICAFLLLGKKNES